MENNWRNKTIEALENSSYGDPATAPTYLVQKCLEYVKLPVGDLNIEQVRLLIGQELGLPYLIPIAIEILGKDILAEGDLYPGDLLKNVTTIDVAFWKANPKLYLQLKMMIEREMKKIDEEGLKLNLPNL